MSTAKQSETLTPAHVKRKIGDAMGVFYLRLYLTANDLEDLEELRDPATLQKLANYVAKCTRRGVFDELRARLMSETNTKALRLKPFLCYFLREANFEETIETRKAAHLKKSLKFRANSKNRDKAP